MWNVVVLSSIVWTLSSPAEEGIMWLYCKMKLHRIIQVEQEKTKSLRLVETDGLFAYILWWLYSSLGLHHRWLRELNGWCACVMALFFLQEQNRRLSRSVLDFRVKWIIKEVWGGGQPKTFLVGSKPCYQWNSHFVYQVICASCSMMCYWSLIRSMKNKML